VKERLSQLRHNWSAGNVQLLVPVLFFVRLYRQVYSVKISGERQRSEAHLVTECL
jgi:hypothetical protein